MRSTALGVLALATIALPTATALDLDDTPAGNAAPESVEAVSNGAVTRVPAATGEAGTVALTSGSFITGTFPGAEAGSQGVVVETPPTFVEPIENSRVTSDFGHRVHPVLDRTKLHEGEDWQGACGTPVRAIADGTVTEAFRHDVSGNRIEIDHGAGLATWSGHLQGFAAEAGDTVQAGDVVGYVGTTGRSTGCHLHLAVSLQGSYVDPAATVWDEAWVAGLGS